MKRIFVVLATAFGKTSFEYLQKSLKLSFKPFLAVAFGDVQNVQFQRDYGSSNLKLIFLNNNEEQTIVGKDWQK